MHVHVAHRDGEAKIWLDPTITVAAVVGFSPILVGDAEAVVRRPEQDFPWFRQATIEQLLNVERPTSDHLYWPQVDVDLSGRSLRDPSAFPLVARMRRVAEGS